MALVRTNDLGSIYMSKEVFYLIILDVFNDDRYVNRIELSTRRGRKIGRLPSIADVDMKEVYVARKGGRLIINFSVVVRFGTSIGKITREVSDDIADRLAELIPGTSVKLVIHIAGVRSHQFARRDSKVVYSYEV